MQVGLYGKLPSHGDFLRRRLSDAFVDTWDAWLQQAMLDCRRTLGEQWLDVYLTSPVWRFSLAPGVSGPAAMAGIIAPSVDRVGRYFPLTIAWEPPGEATALDVALRYQRWYEAAERLLLDTLARDSIDFAEFDQAVDQSTAHLEGASASGLIVSAGAVDALVTRESGYWRVPLPDANRLGQSAVQILAAHLDALYHPAAHWWCGGSDRMDPSWLVGRGLPTTAGFVAMLDGEWKSGGWNVVSASLSPQATTSVTPHPEPDPAESSVVYVSAGHTDSGVVRPINEDAYLDRPDIGIWAVADGMGGRSHGELASRMVCDALAAAPPHAQLDDLVEASDQALRGVNDYLRRSAHRSVNPIESGSTVVALLTRQQEYAVVWAGDSRAYLLRDGALTQLTTDHSWANPDAGLVPDPQVITRAIGGEETLELEVRRGHFKAGDQVLLCSDGLSRSLSATQIGEILLTDTHVPQLCKKLVNSAMDAGSTDNVTALLVRCQFSQEK